MCSVALAGLFGPVSRVNHILALPVIQIFEIFNRHWVKLCETDIGVSSLVACQWDWTLPVQMFQTYTVQCHWILLQMSQMNLVSYHWVLLCRCLKHTYKAVWLLNGWCQVKQLLSWHLTAEISDFVIGSNALIADMWRMHGVLSSDLTADVRNIHSQDNIFSVLSKILF